MTKPYKPYLPPPLNDETESYHARQNAGFWVAMGLLAVLVGSVLIVTLSKGNPLSGPFRELPLPTAQSDTFDQYMEDFWREQEVLDDERVEIIRQIKEKTHQIEHAQMGSQPHK